MNTNSENLKVICAEDCGNAPKKSLLKELTVAYARHDFDFCATWFSDHVAWDIIGDKRISGKVEFLEELKKRSSAQVEELTIDNIITHGNVASVNGTYLFHNGETLAFCDVYQFAGFGKKAKIKAVTSYFIQIT